MITEKLSRRSFVGLVAAGATTCALVGCTPESKATSVPETKAPGTAGSAPESSATPEATAEPVKLTVTLWGSNADAANIEEIAGLFAKANPNIAVEVMLIPTNYDDKLLTMMAAGTPPDVHATLRFTYFSFVAKKVVLNLQPYLDRLGFDRDPYYDVALRPYTFRGSLYGLSKAVDAWTLYYNKDLFDEAGLPYPSGDWTWDDLVSSAQQLTKRDSGGHAEQFGYAWKSTGGCKVFDCFVYQAGGRVVDNEDDPTEFLMAEPEAADGVQFMADLATVHKVMPSPAESEDQGGPEKIWMAGRLAMLYGEWFSGKNYADSEFQWDIAEPARGKKQATWVGGGAWCVNSAGKHLDESVLYAVFAAGPDGSTVMAKNLGGIPNIKEIAESSLFLSHKPPEHNQAVLDSFAYGVQPPMSPTFPEWNRALLAALDPVWAGEKKAAEALTAVRDEVQKQIEDGHKMLEGL